MQCVVVRSKNGATFLSFLRLNFSVLGRLANVQAQALLSRSENKELTINRKGRVVIFQVRLGHHRVLRPRGQAIQRHLRRSLTVFFKDTRLPTVLRCVLRLLQGLVQASANLPEDDFSVLQASDNNRLLQ